MEWHLSEEQAEAILDANPDLRQKVDAAIDSIFDGDLNPMDLAEYWMKRAEIAEAGLTPKWQPIETAPIDGTVVDLWAKRKGTLDTYERVADCFWGNVTDWWGHERQDWIGLYQHQHRSYENPTHWMPLPEPPTAETAI
jgi:hypothetical protein